jgi:hypothetical protein
VHAVDLASGQVYITIGGNGSPDLGPPMSASSARASVAAEFIGDAAVAAQVLAWPSFQRCEW